MDASNRSIVLLGKTGSGKSSLANTIFGEKLFEFNHTTKSETSTCQTETRTFNGRRITVIDTPGFFETKRSEKDLKPEIVKAITEGPPLIHAFLIVLKVEKYTEQEEAVITKIKESFSEEIYKYATVVFTHGDQLKEGQTIQDFVCNERSLKELVEKCGGRCHVIDNKYWKDKTTDEYRSNKFQVKEILQTLDKMMTEHNEGFYTNETPQTMEEKLQQERKTLFESQQDTSPRMRLRRRHSIAFIPTF